MKKVIVPILILVILLAVSVSVYGVACHGRGMLCCGTRCPDRTFCPMGMTCSVNPLNPLTPYGQCTLDCSRDLNCVSCDDWQEYKPETGTCPSTCTGTTNAQSGYTCYNGACMWTEEICIEPDRPKGYWPLTCCSKGIFSGWWGSTECSIPGKMINENDNCALAPGNKKPKSCASGTHLAGFWGDFCSDGCKIEKLYNCYCAKDVPSANDVCKHADPNIDPDNEYSATCTVKTGSYLNYNMRCSNNGERKTGASTYGMCPKECVCKGETSDDKTGYGFCCQRPEEKPSRPNTATEGVVSEAKPAVVTQPEVQILPSNPQDPHLKYDAMREAKANLPEYESRSPLLAFVLNTPEKEKAREEALIASIKEGMAKNPKLYELVNKLIKGPLT